METAITDKIVLDWKFNQLDANKDDKIHRLEFRDMRRLVRKVNNFFLASYQEKNHIWLIKFLLRRLLSQSDAHVCLESN